MKQYSKILINVIFASFISGCATINSEVHADRILAVNRMEGQNEKLIQAIKETLYDDVRVRAVELINDAKVLSSITFDNKYSVLVRETAARRLKHEEDIVRIVQDSSFSIELRNEVASAISSEENSKIIFDCYDLKQDVRLRALKNVQSVTFLRAKVFEKSLEKELRKSVLGQIGDVDLLKEIVASDLPFGLRKGALDKIRNDMEALKALVRGGITGDLLVSTLTHIPSGILGDAEQRSLISALVKEKNPACIECYFSRIDSNREISDSILLKIIRTEGIKEDIKKQSLTRMRSVALLKEIISTKGIQDKYRYFAINQYVKRGASIKDLIFLDIEGSILREILQRIPKEDLRDQSSQNALIAAFCKESDTDCCVAILSCIIDGQNLDSPMHQRKIAKLLKENVSEDIKNLVSKFLADGEVIVDIALGKYGSSQEVALFAVEMAANDIWLQTIASESPDEVVRSYAISRIDSDKIIQPFLISKDEATIVRLTAMRHLGDISTETLQSLTNDQNEVIARVATYMYKGGKLNVESLKESIINVNEKIRKEASGQHNSFLENEQKLQAKFEAEEREMEAMFNKDCESYDKLVWKELKPRFKQIDQEMKAFRSGDFGYRSWDAIVLKKISHWFSSDELELEVFGPYGISITTIIPVENLDRYSEGSRLCVQGNGRYIILN